MDVKLVLYNNEFCPECKLVREKLALLQLPYICINVNQIKAKRQDVYDLTGQYFVPVMIDDNQLIVLKDDILQHLTDKYGDTTTIAGESCGKST